MPRNPGSAKFWRFDNGTDLPFRKTLTVVAYRADIEFFTWSRSNRCCSREPTFIPGCGSGLFEKSLANVTVGCGGLAINDRGRQAGRFFRLDMAFNGIASLSAAVSGLSRFRSSASYERQAPRGQGARRHRSSVVPRAESCRCSYVEFEKLVAPQKQPATCHFLKAAFSNVSPAQVVHILDVITFLRADDSMRRWNRGIFRDIRRAGESGPIVELPVRPGLRTRRVLHGVWTPVLMLAEINPFGVRACPGPSETESRRTRGWQELRHLHR